MDAKSRKPEEPPEFPVNWPAVDQEKRREMRADPRRAVECDVIAETINGAAHMQGKVLDLSLDGCRVVTRGSYDLGLKVRVDVRFKLRGIGFRFVGVTVGRRSETGFAVRFIDVTARRRQELSDTLAEVDAVASTRAPAAVKA